MDESSITAGELITLYNALNSDKTFDVEPVAILQGVAAALSIVKMLSATDNQWDSTLDKISEQLGLLLAGQSFILTELRNMRIYLREDRRTELFEELRADLYANYLNFETYRQTYESRSYRENIIIARKFGDDAAYLGKKSSAYGLAGYQSTIIGDLTMRTMYLFALKFSKGRKYEEVKRTLIAHKGQFQTFYKEWLDSSNPNSITASLEQSENSRKIIRKRKAKLIGNRKFVFKTRDDRTHRLCDQKRYRHWHYTISGSIENGFTYTLNKVVIGDWSNIRCRRREHIGPHKHVDFGGESETSDTSVFGNLESVAQRTEIEAEAENEQLNAIIGAYSKKISTLFSEHNELPEQTVNWKLGASLLVDPPRGISTLMGKLKKVHNAYLLVLDEIAKKEQIKFLIEQTLKS